LVFNFLAERIADSRRREVVETAAAFSNKPRSTSEEEKRREAKLIKFEKLAKKYERISNLHRFKERQASRAIKEGRKKYLEKQQELTNARLTAQAKDSEIRQNILEKINKKADNASKNRSEIIEKRLNTFEEERSKTIEVRKNLHTQKQKSDNNRKKLINQMERKNHQVKHIKQQRSRIEVIKKQVAEKMRQNKIVKIDNPYEVFERRRIATASAKRNRLQSNSSSFT
jgi:hypothetical protein